MSQSSQHPKDRGAFFTPPAISQFISSWAIRSSTDRVLEPSCGDASFLLPSAARLTSLGTPETALPLQLHGIDIHGPSITEANRRLSAQGYSASIKEGDFFDQEPSQPFDAVIGNPPYIRYQDFSGLTRAKSLRAALAKGVRLTSLASSWAAFTIHATEFLADDGRLGMVLPAELMSVNYAAEVRRFLMNRFAKVRLIIFEQLLFPGVLEEVVLLLAEGRGSTKSFEVFQARNADSLSSIDTSSWRGFAPNADEKWTSALIPEHALDVYRSITQGGYFEQLHDWGNVYLGSVTGNNDFFALSAQQIADLALKNSDVVKISPPGSRHLRGLTFSARTWSELAKDGARCFLFSPNGNQPSKAALEFIRSGEEQGVHKAYKCRVRAPWWQVPLVNKPDLFFTYMNHDRPRLIANSADAFVLNSLYGVSLRPELQELGKAALPVACLNTVTLLGAEVVGRSYGGGLLKHEPKEADLLPVPTSEILEGALPELQLAMPQLSIALRQNKLLEAVELVDAIVLERHLRLNSYQLADLRRAREALFLRRVARGKKNIGKS